MTHPVTPPFALIRRVSIEAFKETEGDTYIANFFSGWGADQELSAISDQLIEWGFDSGWIEKLRRSRRPVSPSLKEQALEQLDGIATVFRVSHGGNLVCDKIRQALEQLPND